MTLAADIVGVLGATGSGKSLYVRQQLKSRRPRRLVIWDFKGEYPGSGCAMLELVEGMRDATFGLVFRPDMLDDARRSQQFELVCRAVQLAGNCTLVVEELQFVTNPYRPPPAWRQLVLTGRDRGISIIATSQRPAGVDKDFLGSCSLLHVGRQSDRGSVETSSQWLMVDRAEVQQLKPLEWIERDTASGNIFRGTMKLPRPPKGTA